MTVLPFFPVVNFGSLTRGTSEGVVVPAELVSSCDMNALLFASKLVSGVVSAELLTSEQLLPSSVLERISRESLDASVGDGSNASMLVVAVEEDGDLKGTESDSERGFSGNLRPRLVTRGRPGNKFFRWLGTFSFRSLPDERVDCV